MKSIALFAVSCVAVASFGAFKNGDVWNDTDGVHINAHGGALMKDGDTWYWYGEHKTEGGNGNKAWVGVSCYSSKDLLAWKREGVAFAVSKEKGSPVEEGCILERPKVVKAQDGSGYAMFFHLEPKGSGYSGAQTGIAKAKTPTGPFELVWAGRPNAGQKPIGAEQVGDAALRCATIAPWGGEAKLWPEHLAGGQMSRDMTLYTDPKDGTVYHLFASEDNSCLHLAEVRPDGLGYTGKWARLSPDDWTEAPAVVKHGDWYFLIGSGCTGWRPNAARYYRAKSVWGPWERMGNPCRGVNPQNGKGPETTWGGQSTGIFETGGRAFAMFDIWKPSNAIDGRYVWLPIEFNDRGEMKIDWRDSFTPVVPEPWEDEYVSERNRLPARSVMNPVDPGRTLSLDGEWDFTYVDAGKTENCTLTVPGSFQLQGFRLGKKWDVPQYVNIQYPFAFDPPHIDGRRGVRGIYRKTVTVPADWKGRRMTLRLYGYSSAVYVKVDGKEVGYGEDGRLPNEWDLSAYANAGEFDLEIEVLKHCDGSYLEDQDFWRMSGLFRSVELVSEAQGGLTDFSVATRVSGKDGVVSVKGLGTDDYFWKLFDNRGEELATGMGGQEVVVPSVRLWSHETPYLYRVEVIAKGDAYRRDFGFRTVSIEPIASTDTMKGGMALCVNGKRIVVNGVDRHEMSATGGYAMTREEMEKDVALMKEFGINAVRTSHYPNDPYWYALCDRNGIYVVAEANIECHGSGHPLKTTALSHVASWRKSFLERNLNQVAVLKDHPSIILWSLGNESGYGPNMPAAYEAVKAADPTRPVQYEGVFNPYGQLRFDVYGSDIICPMYETPAKIERAMAKGFKRPYILCEFAHAMGNSTGNFREYWELTKKYASFQGGFIWDFADQALLRKDGIDKGNGAGEADNALMYGGDFGDRPNDGNGHCNGLFDALRNPHPGAYEVAHFYGGEASMKVGPVEDKAMKVSDEALARVVSSLRFNFYRAPTDNDRGNGMARRAGVWKQATETQVLPEGCQGEIKTVPQPDGSVRVKFVFKGDRKYERLPRVGVTLELAGTPDCVVSWKGLGPQEAYCDRKDSTREGVWTMSVKALNASGYVRPQEMGHRVGTKELRIGGLRIESTDKPFEWNLLPWTTAELSAAKHIEDLPKPNGKLYLSIDAAMRGVGGNDSWGAMPLDEYLLDADKEYAMEFVLSPDILPKKGE